MWGIQSECVGLDGPVRYFWVPNFGDAYVIGDDGSLWSRHQRYGFKWILSNDWIVRNPSLDADGYLHADLRYNGAPYTKAIHKLVCEAVYGPCPVGEEVCHNDGVKINNKWWNLRYDTPVGNCADRATHGNDYKGEGNPNVRYNWIIVREIRAKYFSGGHTYESLALEYGMNQGSVGDILTYRTWIE